MTCTAARHGTYRAYRWNGCRCPEAGRDHSRRQKHQRAGLIPPQLVDGTGTRRRLQALARLGHTTAVIGAHAGRHGQVLCNVLRAAHPLVHADTARDVKRAYDALSLTIGTSPITARRAERKSWQPPLAWDDDTIDDPEALPAPIADAEFVDDLGVDLVAARAGLPLTPEDKRRVTALTEAERDEVIRRVHAAGRDDVAIAELLGISKSAAWYLRSTHLHLPVNRKAA